MTLTLMDYKSLFVNEEANYNHETNQQIYEWADLVQTEFLKSPNARRLSEDALNSLYLISLFAEIAYSYHLTKPGHWTELEVRDVCCHLIPQKLIAPIETFEQLPAIFEAIFLWGEEIGIFDGVENWCKILNKHKNDILNNAQIPGNWELSKSLILES